MGFGLQEAGEQLGWSILRFLGRHWKPIVTYAWKSGLIFPIIGAAVVGELREPWAKILVFVVSWGLCAVTAGWYIKKWLDKKDAPKRAEEATRNPSMPSELAPDAPGSVEQTPGSVVSSGVYFGMSGRNHVVKPENMDGHVLVVGGVGSGKSSCIAIPTLRTWKSRVFAIDIKGELYAQTKDYRPHVKVINPLSASSFGYDPYFTLHSSHNKAQEARAIAQALIPIPPHVTEPFWLEAARNLLCGAILHFHAEGRSFYETVFEILSSTHLDLANTIYNSPVPEARFYISSFIGMSDKTLAGVMAELAQNVVVFVTDPNLITCLSNPNIITPSTLETADIYLQIPEHLLNQWRNFVTLIINQFLTYFEQRGEYNDTPILFLLDEFPRLGKIPDILNGLATLRSKKVTILPIIQSLKQLDAIYGANESKIICDLCAYKAILSASDADTQEYFSKLIGTYEPLDTTQSAQYDPYTHLPQSKGTSTSPREKRIIKPEDFATLADIVLLNPHNRFCRVGKVPFWRG